MDILEVLIKALAAKSTFNGDISKWDTGKVTNMYTYVLSPLLRSTKTLGVGTQRK